MYLLEEEHVRTTQHVMMRYLLVSVLSLILTRYSPFGSQCVYEVGLMTEIR